MINITLKNIHPPTKGDKLLKHFMDTSKPIKPKVYTIGEIQDLSEWLSFNVGEGYLDEDIANNLLESKNYKEIERLRDMADLNAN